ncbi:hypothetical protein [Streptomyces lancefieldiae]|uniref:Uncharacterized protein n=1 Tax=Streptomyces lancefieldiae TaxID=3075520 RepID=A0ABU3AW96_9ACTN|nr:hypothetical protein [Streptomyces sp. DSM 40712]MDT0614468.1 hypothetical protein [Streptomyces sp. DSM 40712]
MADPNTSDPAPHGSHDNAAQKTAVTGRVRFGLARWVLDPRTTWQARRLAADLGKGMDAHTAWMMSRLTRHPDEYAHAMYRLESRSRHNQ